MQTSTNNADITSIIESINKKLKRKIFSLLSSLS